jgi:hypothetical protein
MSHQEKIQQIQLRLNKESARISIAETRSKARLKLLDAAIHEGDHKVIEQARLESLAAFEAFLDSRIIGITVIGNLMKAPI